MECQYICSKLNVVFQTLNFYSEEQYLQHREIGVFFSEEYLKTKSIHVLPKVNEANEQLDR